jgi:hypothetical protein
MEHGVTVLYCLAYCEKCAAWYYKNKGTIISFKRQTV